MHNIILSYGRPQMPDNVNRVLAEAEETAADEHVKEEIEQPATSPFLTYKDLEWEIRAPRKRGTIQKEIFTYEDHEARLKEEDWDRAPTPQEISALLIDYLKGKLREPLQSVAHNMLYSCSEWTCHASLLERNTLYIYENVQNVNWNICNSVNSASLSCTGIKSFTLPNLLTGIWNTLTTINTINPALITYLYTKPLHQLPKEMQHGSKNSKLYIRDTTFIMPLGRGGYSFSSDFNSGRASRGVRKIRGSNA